MKRSVHFLQKQYTLLFQVSSDDRGKSCCLLQSLWLCYFSFTVLFFKRTFFPRRVNSGDTTLEKKKSNFNQTQRNPNLQQAGQLAMCKCAWEKSKCTYTQPFDSDQILRLMLFPLVIVVLDRQFTLVIFFLHYYIFYIRFISLATFYLGALTVSSHGVGIITRL